VVREHDFELSPPHVFRNVIRTARAMPRPARAKANAVDQLLALPGRRMRRTVIHDMVKRLHDRRAASVATCRRPRSTFTAARWRRAGSCRCGLPWWSQAR
jgi:hypothetical protein